MTSGEYPAASGPHLIPPPGESTLRVTIPTILSLASVIGTVVVGYANFAVMQDRMDTVREEVAALKIERKAHDEDAFSQKLRLQRVEDSYTQLTQTLGEMKSDIRDIKAGVVAAGGRGR